jgi:hypothetical protein
MEWANQLVSALQRHEDPPARQLEIRGEFADDAAAAAGGVQVGELYRTGSAVQVRVT